ncbi:uncharacterized protein TRIADDRAFT_52591 [Trichoplax adhaerens]|uniref:Neural retina-specific leucine zipper protein n=1 Tax=Trichoplax adhaerens TaxID=10228 RepID=B3RJE0_TRIAD|nr:hypothetical protein TRIADDRAFT_52591 [Trichoplax adhaerens]EDV29807.1 hypothetical protein TRIADDRAFT_52591 [Trichoplax adhaerens]|eukprot:XP_002109009.1 hypothetical protein TRIADDRAFT_52591 [Trichoplax adhaerens]
MGEEFTGDLESCYSTNIKTFPDWLIPEENGSGLKDANYQDPNIATFDDLERILSDQSNNFNEDSLKKPILPDDMDYNHYDNGSQTPNICDKWMSSNSDWLNYFTSTADAIGNDHDALCSNDCPDDSTDQNSSVDQVESNSLVGSSDDSKSDDCSVIDDMSNINRSSDEMADVQDRNEEKGKINDHQDFTDDALCRMRTKELNMCLNGFSDKKKEEIKRRRRTLKNRGYAQNSRAKRVKEAKSMLTVVIEQRSIITKLRREKEQTAQERDKYKQLLLASGKI